MNCQNFETVVGVLARGVPLEARAREEARSHEASCARCAARLADESALSTGLRALAASAGGASAPPRVEANLLAAFRAAAAETPAGREAFPTAKVVPLARPESAKRWGWAKTFGAAATAAAAAVTLFVLVRPQRPAPGQLAATPAASRPLVNSAPPVAPQVPTPVAASPVISTDPRGGAGDEVAAVAPRVTSARRIAHARPAAVYQNAAGGAARPAPAAEAGDEEIATDFIPLTQDARLAAAEGGQVVRVELPRTALQRFGLPMNVERAGGRVKADVLLGHDGVAHAIRFVR
jgi:hypothetical protein